MSVYDVYVLGGNIPGSCGSASPRTNRASRPLSAVFQSLQPPSLWRNRKSSSPLTQVQTHTNSILLLHFHLNHFMVLFCLKHDYTMCLKRLHVCRYLWVQRGPLSVAVCKDAKRAKGNGRGCGSCSKTRCSTPLKHERWGDPESPTPAQTLDNMHTNTHTVCIHAHITN